MSALGPRINQVLAIAIGAIGIASCSSDLGEPDRPLPTSPAFASMTIEIPSELSFVDDDGTGYTLNVAAREIRMSDGRVLVLDAGQNAEAIAAFSRVLATDPVASDLSQITYTPDCDIVECEAEPYRLVEPGTV